VLATNVTEWSDDPQTTTLPYYYRAVHTYVLEESWRPIGIESTSNQWGAAANVDFTVYDEEQITLTADVGVEFEQAVTINLGVGVSHTDGRSAAGAHDEPATADTKWRIEAYIKHRKVVKYTSVYRRQMLSDEWLQHESYAQTKGEGDVLGSFDYKVSKQQRHWLDEEGLGSLDVVAV
jgi:hypothetical protein